MPINDLTNYAKIDSYISEQVERFKFALIRTLKYVAESVANTARNSGSYENQTGNLRSSVGAVISVDGKIEWKTSFNSVKQGKQGAKDGQTFAEQLAKRVPQGIALIVVAGKNYAIHVANRGYDVLDSAELEAEQLIPKMLKTLNV